MKGFFNSFFLWISAMLKIIFFLCFLLPIPFSCSHDVINMDELPRELDECASLLKSHNDVAQFYARFGFGPLSTNRPLEQKPENEDWVEIGMPYADINHLIMDIWQLVMVRVAMDDIMPLTFTCKTTYTAYCQLPFNGIIRKKILIYKDFQRLRQDYRFLETPDGKPNFIFPETTQAFAHRMATLCHEEENLKNLIKRRLGTDKQEKDEEMQNDPAGNLFLKNERAGLLAILNDNWMPNTSIHRVIEEAARNYPLSSTKEQDDDLAYLALYSQYPHVVNKKHQLLRNALLQLGVFMILEAPQVYGLYRYFQLVPPVGSVLKTIVELTHPYIYGVGDSFTRAYPYVPHPCVAHYSPGAFWTYNPDYEFKWHSGNSSYCTGSWFDGAIRGNLTECMAPLAQLNLNTTFWNAFFNGSNRLYGIPCSLNLDGAATTCGRKENWGKELKFEFNIADINCANNHWAAGYGSIAVLGILGSSFLFWEMLGGYYKNDGCFACIGLICYIVSFITVYSVPSTYGNG